MVYGHYVVGVIGFCINVHSLYLFEECSSSLLAQPIFCFCGNRVWLSDQGFSKDYKQDQPDKSLAQS